MSHVEHAYPRAYEAACKVDPMILASALDHIAKTADRSRSQSRRTRWIKARAESALAGNDYADAGVDLPKSAGPNTGEKLQRRMAYHIAMKHELADALRDMLDADDHDEAKRKARVALAKYAESLTPEANGGASDQQA